ncbi:MAG: recombinase family protein, partial [Eubacteriales bacterium]
MNQGTEKFTILYARLSQEDKNRGVSDSIENQKVILEKFAEEHGFPNCLFKFDDGVSGTVFDRPAWSEVMELIESQRVGILIVKDGSRLGRNYWRVGELIEDIFPRNQVRYISITENDDSLHGIDDFLPFRSVMNDLQAKETSKKIKTVKQAKAQRGERIGSKPPYGYQAVSSDKRKMIPDPEA